MRKIIKVVLCIILYMWTILLSCGVVLVINDSLGYSDSNATILFILTTASVSLIFSLIYTVEYFKQKYNVLNKDNKMLESTIAELNQILNNIGYPDYEKINNTIQQNEIELEVLNNKIIENKTQISNYELEINILSEDKEKLAKKISSQVKKLHQVKELHNGILYSIENYRYDPLNTNCIDSYDIDLINSLVPNVILKLHHMDIKDLKQAFRDNDKVIAKLLEQYESKYTTKANRTIYQLLIIALKAELQNILYNLKYAKLDIAVSNVKSVTSKYLKLAGDGNRTILPTLTKFIGEIEYLFINSVKIEYNYYVKKEQQRQEQIALREKMRQEAEEKKALEAERKKIEQEELKFTSEIEKLQSTVTNTTNEIELQALHNRILELQSQLSDVAFKKEEITKLQNGKAGNVYIISNLGSFGENIFKIGMTRRLEPQDRINELGSASVPFKFDVHSFIFSEDAVSLENSLHQKLNSNRVNKVNLRKEFFKISVDELEELVFKIDPTATFNKTMVAEEYNQSLSTNEVYDTSAVIEYDGEVE